MLRNPTKFEQRFQRWKNGEQVYKDGRIVESYYDTMERVAEQNNEEWNRLRRKDGDRELTVDEEYLRILNDNTYDYKGYYNKYPNGKGNAIDHWDDEFKTVYHPTFSTQSKYSGKVSQYNPKGVLGGQWLGDQYVPAWGQKLPHFEDGKDSDQTQLSTALNNFGYRLLSFLPYTRILTNVFDIADISPDAQQNAIEDLTDGSGLTAGVLQNKKYVPINNGTLARQIADAKNQAWKKALRPLKAIDVLGDASQLYKDYKILNNAAKKTHGVYKSGITIDPYSYH